MCNRMCGQDAYDSAVAKRGEKPTNLIISSGSSLARPHRSS